MNRLRSWWLHLTAAVLMLCMTPHLAHAALDYEEVFYGRYTISVDGGGNASGDNYDIGITKPVGGTVFKAFVITTTVDAQPDPGAAALTMTVGGLAINPILSNVSVSDVNANPQVIYSRWAEVTSDLSASFDAAPAGPIAINMRENVATARTLDGSALFVIWNDPSAPSSAVGLKFGAETTATPVDLSISTRPLNTADPLFNAEIGIGLSFSTATGDQINRLTFENTVITDIAGGADDGAIADGALWTIGGEGDTPSRLDNDERYDVTDLIAPQATSLDIQVANVVGHTRDYVFAIWFQARASGNIAIDTPADNSVFTAEPSYSGYAVSGTTVTLTWLDLITMTTVTTTTVTDAQGNWSVPPQGLPDGNYTLTASAPSPVIITTDEITFTIDSTVPVLTIITPLDGSSTTDTTPTLSGTGEPGADVVLTLADAMGNTIETLTVTPDMTGAWSVDAAVLAEGQYTVTATSTDAAGNVAVPVSSTFTVDTTAPSVALDTPVDNSLNNDPTPTVSGTSEAGSVVTVSIFDAQGVLVQAVPVVADAAGNFNGDVPVALADGTYTVVATSTDLAGNSVNDTHTFTIDATDPVLTLQTPVNGSSTSDDTPTISGTTDTISPVFVTVTDAQGMVVFTSTVTPDMAGNYTVDTTTLPEGAYTVEASTTDLAGNTATRANTFSVDTTAPALDITAPTDNIVVGVRDVAVSGTSDAGQEVIVELQDAQGMVVATLPVTTDANGAWTVTFQGLANGDYVANASATDAAMNSATDTVSFSVDSDDPNLTVENPVADATLSDVTPTINGTTNPDSVITVIITDAQGNVVETLTVTPDASGAWTTEPTQDLADGPYTVSTTATRPNGRTTTIDRDITIDTVDPTVVVTSPADGSTINETAVVVTGTTEPNASVLVTVTDSNDMVVFTGTVTADDQGDFSADAGDLTNGEFTVDAVATDAAGNTSEAQNTFTIDTTAPTLTISSPVAGDTVEDTTPTITGTADAGAEVEVFVDGVSVGTVTADDQGQWSFDVTDPLAEGAHTVEAKTSNAAGTDASTGEVDFTVGTPGDDVVITSPTEGSEVTGPSVVVTGTGTPGEEVTVTIGGQTQTVVVDDNGDWTTTVTDVPSGDTTITATSDGKTSTVNVTVIDPALGVADDLLLVGGACGGSSTTGTSSPASGLVWLLVCVGGVFGYRRRRR